ncbi:MAG TPA: guanitoxin biosynthesis heme-dependent pre-guanitoxin N-hydroxylase GntA [Erythrobacter sp.]|nr:guanitoxin biosynthesis heme-dependent pre-guanitoxin N-hydroxylase GntA [Erythrobacter sp.]
MQNWPFALPRGAEKAARDEDDTSRLAASLVTLIEEADFPCVGAKSALAQSGLRIETARDITSTRDDRNIHKALARWSRTPADDTAEFRSLAVIFAGPRDLDECAFEAALWDRLSNLTAHDRACGYVCEAGYSADPKDPNFALSFGGRAYFAVGLHPLSSRKARRLPYPAIIFNLHNQFERMREADRYERMREVILARDEEFDGTPNPMVARHGEVSEARQYSGRAVGDDWQCPFNPAKAR